MADVRPKPPREEAKPNSPVRWIPADEERGKPEAGIGLCLSGGGYRAMLFHLGALWRLNELGYLQAAERASPASPAARSPPACSASAGPAEFDASAPRAVPAPSTSSDEVVGADPRARRQHASTCRRSSPACCCRARRSATSVAAAYRRHLFGDATLQDLPATRTARASSSTPPTCSPGSSGASPAPTWRDYRVGTVAESDGRRWPTRSPPPPPSRRSWRRCGSGSTDDQLRPGRGERPADAAVHHQAPSLADGGVYDNLGLETAWKTCKTVLVSDGGGAMEPDGGKFGPFRAIAGATGRRRWCG